MINKLIIALIRVYQLVISPILGPRCRFYPTCSHYAIEALQLHGPIKGSFLAARRVLRCHPGNPGGIDPVPTKECLHCKQSDSNDEQQNRHADLAQQKLFKSK